MESHSHSLLEFIPWSQTADHNVAVLTDTSDYYRYFDATAQAEFLFDCVAYTLTNIIPQEVAYLQQYNAMKSWLDEQFQMSDKLVALLIRFLGQSQEGVLSKRARENEFALFSEEEVQQIEQRYALYFTEP
ncbi:hypothetical protein [Hymenobacter defluvii]|uniref:hypothetical protein n=1 Tax=Hymenobacter defluvii TaxID=2054411 RepID=UPI001FB8BA85|nr:hypothetical protein [Hymenobacter defluvii]